MKLLSSFSPSKRTIAEAIWGKGGTTLRKMNDARFAWYSCSSHGGCIVDPSKLTETERRKIYGGASEWDIFLCVGDYNGETFVLGVNYPYGKKSVKYNATFTNVHWEKRTMWVFEEDCQYAFICAVMGVEEIARVERLGLTTCMNKAKEVMQEVFPEFAILDL